MEEEKQTTEVRQTNEQSGGTNVQRETVSRATSTSGVVIIQRVVWFLAGVIIALLALRILLLLLAANQGTPFVDFVYVVSGMFAAPFYGIFSYEPSYGKSVFEVSSLVAIIVYALVAWGIAKLVTLTRPHEEI